MCRYARMIRISIGMCNTSYTAYVALTLLAALVV